MSGNITVFDREIWDSRSAYLLAFDQGARHAIQQGFNYMLFNGLVADLQNEKCLCDGWEEAVVFFPSHGFWFPESLPFIGWKEGYEYQGNSQWLMGKNVSCDIIEHGIARPFTYTSWRRLLS